jgi:nitronate monooxygenase
LQLIKSLTKKPFGVNFTLLEGNSRYEKRIHEWMDIAIEKGVQFFLISLGNPKWVCKEVHKNGGVVYHDVSTKKIARIAIEADVNGLNCVNNTAGGQTGITSPLQMVKNSRI